MFLVAEEQDSTACLNSPLLFIFKAHDTSCSHDFSDRRHSNLPACPMKYLRRWSHVSAVTTLGTHTKTFFQSVQKHCREKEKVENKNKGNCKKLCVNTQTPKIQALEVLK